MWSTGRHKGALTYDADHHAVDCYAESSGDGHYQVRGPRRQSIIYAARCKVPRAPRAAGELMSERRWPRHGYWLRTHSNFVLGRRAIPDCRLRRAYLRRRSGCSRDGVSCSTAVGQLKG